MPSHCATEQSEHHSVDRRRFWRTALLIYVAVFALAAGWLWLFLGSVIDREAGTFERSAAVVAGEIEQDLAVVEGLAAAVSIGTRPGDLAEMHRAGVSTAPGWQGKFGDSIVASFVYEEHAADIAAWGDSVVPREEIDALALRAITSGTVARGEWWDTPDGLGVRAIAHPVRAAVPWTPGGQRSPVVGAYVCVLDLREAVEHEREVLFAITGHDVRFVAGDEPPLPLDWVQARVAIEGTPYAVSVERRRFDIVWDVWPVLLYSELGVLGVALAGTFANGMYIRARRQRDTEAFARELLSERITSEEKFLAAMSHEMRTPLNSIIGFTGVMLDELAGPVTEEQRRQLWMVERSGRRLLGLVNDVLDVSRIHAGQVSPEVAVVDAVAAGRTALDLIEPSAAVKSLALRLEHDEAEVRVHTDAEMLGRILSNLLSNAVKFSENGTVTLAIAQRDGSVQFTVRDEGPGLSAEEMTRISEEFYQVPRTADQAKPEGTGLGLPIAMRLARVLGGTLVSESEPGAGSAFTLVLPIEWNGQAADSR